MKMIGILEKKIKEKDNQIIDAYENKINKMNRVINDYKF